MIIRNDTFREKLVGTTTEEGQLRWLGHVHRMSEDKIVKRVFEAKSQKKVKTRKTWQQETIEAAVKRGVKWEEERNYTIDWIRWKEMTKQNQFNITTIALHRKVKRLKD